MKNMMREVARRGTALLLSAVLVFCLLPSTVMPAQAAAWMNPYLEKLVSWGAMRGNASGDLRPDDKITRAEFVTMVNRAYGYQKTGKVPFTDVPEHAWYAEDIAIAYNTGYFAGTSATTAGPKHNLTREQAALLIGRNMMLQSGVGEVLEFTDGREISDWSRGIVQAAAKAGVVSGYPDGGFHPKKHITRGEVAVMLVRAIGQPIQEPGLHSLGGVYGNVTITTPGVTLKDTVIAGDLYLSGGIGLGDVLLDNVTVLGRIVVSGGGESHKGDSSVILRNVTAKELTVDGFGKQSVSIRAEGDTAIETTDVRLDAYLEDATRNGLGLRYIELNGKPGCTLQLAGNIKEVVNAAPESQLIFAKGVAGKITIDEKAVDSSLVIENGAHVKELNLDVGTEVTGQGDIGHLNVNAPGSKVSMLPDTITIRPGITAKINGGTMDTVTAAESSADPRFLAGYPEARNVAPTNAEMVFSTNKKGTIYWAVSALADGSVSGEDLVSPPAYSGKILKKGNLTAKQSKTEIKAKVSGLTAGGSYYLSAVLVDDRGEYSPVKVIAFTTPDDTVPGFASGYPFMSQVTNDYAQVAVMPTKSCELYYALLPKGSTAPKAIDFKTNNVSGNLGFGTRVVTRNVVELFRVNSQALQELESYDLYLWMTDFDGARSSSVKKLSFTTVDKTAPLILHMDVTGAKPTSVELTYALNEPGSLYWAVVKEGEDYPKPISGQSEKPDLADDAAKIQVESGMNALKNGSSRASKAQTDAKITVSGLTAQTAYDLYYVAKDTAGNYSDVVKVMTISTKDDQSPDVTQEFTRYNGNEKNEPLADTDARLVFTESVQGVETVQGERVYTPFMPLYQAVQKAVGAQEKNERKEALGEELKKHITLYQITDAGQASEVAVGPDDESWVINYNEAVITMEGGRMVITFPTGTALRLASGATYRFEISGIADNSTAANLMGDVQLPDFTTVFAQVILGVGNARELSGADLVEPNDESLDEQGNLRIDMGFTMDPLGTDRVDPATVWDALLWTDTSMTYSLYSKGEGEEKWTKEGTVSVNVAGSPDGRVFSSLKRQFQTECGQPVFDPLKSMEPREYAIHVDSIGDSKDYTAWNRRVTFRVMIVAGSQFGLDNLSNGSYITDWETSKKDNGTVSIGVKDPFELKKLFTDTKPPKFVDNFPIIKAGDIAAEIEVMIDRPGKVYYVAVPLDVEYDENGEEIENIENYTCPVLPSIWDDALGKERKPMPWEVPESGDHEEIPPLELVAPGVNTVTGGSFTGTVRSGVTGSMEGNNSATLHLTNLSPNTIYYVYLVTQGTSAVYSDQALCYRFKTDDAVRPIIELNIDNPDVQVEVDRSSFVSYLLVSDNGSVFNLYDAFNTVAPDAPGDYALDSYRVLDALTEDYFDDDGDLKGTVFDEYATEKAKNTLNNNIRNSKPDASKVTLKALDVAINQGNMMTVDCSGGLVGDGYYIFLAVGHSQLGSSNAFRAVRPVQRVDNEAPKIILCQVSGTGAGCADKNEAQKKFYTGELNVVFDEDLYYQWMTDVDQVRLPVDHTKKNEDFKWTWEKDKYVPLGNLIEFPFMAKVYIAKSNPGQNTNVMQFYFENMSVGSTITIRNGLCDRGGATRGVLTLTLQLRQDEEKNWVPYFAISPSGWDAAKT